MPRRLHPRGIDPLGAANTTDFLRRDGAWDTPPGGGSCNSRDRRWRVGSAETSIDEFNDSVLDPAWTRVDGTGAAAGNLSWTEAADVLSVKSIGGDSASTTHGLLRPLSGAGGSMVVGDAFVTYVNGVCPSTNYAVVGLAVTDGTTHGAGTQMWAQVNLTVAAQPTLMRCGGFNSVAAHNGISGQQGMSNGVYLRLVKLASNVWRMDASPDGVSWMTTGTLTHNFTPTHVGFMDSSWGGTFQRASCYEFLRRVSGIT